MLVGIGQPIMDLICTVDEEFLQKYELKINTANVATLHQEQLFKEKIISNAHPGGCIFNTLATIQYLINKPNTTTFIGSAGNDSYSYFLEKVGIKKGINIKFERKHQATTTCAVLITDKQRTLCTKIGAGNNFTIADLRKNWEFINNAEYVYIVGFFLTVSVPCIMEIARHCLKDNKQLIMNLSAEFICEQYRNKFMEVFPYVDVIFGNQSEAEAFSRANNFEAKNLKEICLEMLKLPRIRSWQRKRIVVITQGENPVLLATNGKVEEFPVEKLPEGTIIDTAGAGDVFVGGFLSMYIQSTDLHDCVKRGISVARRCVQRGGSRIWEDEDYD